MAIFHSPNNLRFLIVKNFVRYFPTDILIQLFGVKSFKQTNL